MKKLLFGAMLLAWSMANDWTLNGQSSALWNISRYGLPCTPSSYDLKINDV